MVTTRRSVWQAASVVVHSVMLIQAQIGHDLAHSPRSRREELLILCARIGFRP
jgi:hypothetical protein